MSMTDPIADFLTRIRNGIHGRARDGRHPVVQAQARDRPDPAGAGLHRRLRGRGADRRAPGEILRVQLKYTDDRRSAISGLKRVSRPGQRTYVGHAEIPKVLGGMGTAIVSTSNGVMTGHEARQAGVGGEVVAHVW